MARCTQCSTPAVYQIEGHYLCISCTLRLKEIQRLDFNMNGSMLNLASEEMSLSVGGLLPAPKVQLIAGSPIGGNVVTYHNINVSGGNVGVLNTGYIRELDANMTVLKAAPSEEIYPKLKAFSEAVVKDSDLSNDDKDAVMENLAFVSSELGTPEEQRKSRIARQSLSAIDKINLSSSLLTIWDHLRPLLAQYFGG